MNMKTLPTSRPWRTTLLVLSLAVADVLFSMVVLGLGLEDGTVPETGGIELLRFLIAPALAPLGAVALIWRHRLPKTVAAATAVLGVLSFSGLAALVALYLLARRRLSWWVAAIIALAIAAEAWLGVEPLTWDLVLIAVVFYAAIAVWAAYRGQRTRAAAGNLVALQERAERAEAARATEVERAQLLERQRIAREMHDTLAHRMSLVAVQASALQMAAPDADTSAAARGIRETAHAALRELRDVLGVLHADGTRDKGAEVDAGFSTSALSAPGGIAQIPGLVEQWRGAGLAVELGPELGSALQAAGGLPDTVGRAAFRVVQEGLTNVARHAPHAQAVVSLFISKDELCVTVANGPGAAEHEALGSGLGLAGLAERVGLLGGTLEHGATLDGFELAARIPLGVGVLV